MLAWISISRPWSTNGARSALTIRSGSPSAGSASSTPELVSAEPGGGVARPDRRAHPPGDLDEQVVAGGVAEAVVDPLEVVEVDEENRRVGGGRRECLRDALREEHA